MQPDPWSGVEPEHKSAESTLEGSVSMAQNNFNGQILMLGYMNKEALDKTILTKEAHYWSRSRKALWKKGESSGMVHKIDEILIDDDQDSIWLKVTIEGLGARCHVGYKSCFYRSVDSIEKDGVILNFTESEKVFDPEEVYPGIENPTKL